MMTRLALEFTLVTSLIGAAVATAGVWAVGSAGAAGVVWGAVVAVLVQVAIFWTLFVWAMPDRKVLAHALGVAVRLVAVAGMAFAGVAGLGLDPAPTLLSMVVCLFGSTVLEAVFLQRRAVAEMGTGVATIRR